MTTKLFEKKSMEALGRLDAISAINNEHFPVWAVLDDVRSMHNVGAVFRTADSFNLSGIYLCGVTPQPPHRDIHKTALGATESVHWQYAVSAVHAIQALKKDGYTIIGVEQTHNSKWLNAYPFKAQDKIALVLGNEVHGVSDEALALCDSVIEIPQFGSKHSLNISVAAGVVLWEAVSVYIKQS
jgi:23S rRNA (guanosine2251-2'-O)-methyltransferase